ncbi:MAG: HD-GYP domain-containing protein [Ardenticatenia bacterium]|nr:HD-GYP domain-containing protein [Ardenticatenia bacterium]
MLFSILYLGDRLAALHSLRTAAYAVHLAREVQTHSRVVFVVRLAGLLHDIGKLGVPRYLLYKADALRPEEFEAIKRHAEYGAYILERYSPLHFLAKPVRHVHENFDGTGYPDGLKGHEIPLESRILAVADAFDALTTDRPYRQALPTEEALRILKLDAGHRWDPELVRVFSLMWEEGHLRLPSFSFQPPDGDRQLFDSAFHWLHRLEQETMGVSPAGDEKAKGEISTPPRLGHGHRDGTRGASLTSLAIARRR